MGIPSNFEREPLLTCRVLLMPLKDAPIREWKTRLRLKSPESRGTHADKKKKIGRVPGAESADGSIKSECAGHTVRFPGCVPLRYTLCLSIFRFALFCQTHSAIRVI